ncbi:hypothetical protein AQUCO_02200309v1 [Aquilegia coerulea]|uniref:F-box associated domain-containing protein n=1 Tax=Aquilegia coerulea TaxID=218851 RepID=A0A2G5DE89_AQUCA|nr:hypothetical protein AQUCO_02200309v1 [Aquilegia coerulea]
MLPEYNIKWELKIFEINGCLYLVNFPKNQHCFIVWILEDWEDKKWTKLYQKYRQKTRCQDGSCMCSGSDFSIFDYINDKHFDRVYHMIIDEDHYCSSKHQNWIPYFSSLVDVKQLIGIRKSGSTGELPRNYFTFPALNYMCSLLESIALRSC